MRSFGRSCVAALSGFAIVGCGTSTKPVAGLDAGVADASFVKADASSNVDGSMALDANSAADTTTPFDDASAAACTGSKLTPYVAGPAQPSAPAVALPPGFIIETIASISGARELAALPNGDLLVATSGSTIQIIPNAEAAGAPNASSVFATIPDSPAQGIAFDTTSCTVFVAAQHGVYSMAYADAQLTAQSGSAIAQVRTGSIAPNTDGDVHTTSSVAVSNGVVYAAVGSSCNACVETDPTRATVQQMDRSGANMTTKATRIRNAIALAVNPDTGTVWGGGAGQDDLASGHPFEYFSTISLKNGPIDFGWPDCEENHIAYVTGSDCSKTEVPVIELPPYSTIIGATFYPDKSNGKYAFPDPYPGGVFLSAHGSWHKQSNNQFVSPPRVAFVGMYGDAPKTGVNWNDPTAQWTEFVGGFQLADGLTRIGRPTGIAVGSQGSLFVADDQNGLVYRIRPHQ
jgi:glucose/arabinose dehydrogenase